MEKHNLNSKAAAPSDPAATRDVGGVRSELVVYAAAIRAEGRWVSCALVCPRLNSWVYLEQLDLPGASMAGPNPARPWLEELRKVPHVKYADSDAHMGALVREQFAAMLDEAGMGPSGHVVVRAAQTAGLAELLGCEPQLIDLRPGILRMFHKKCGSASGQPREHALLKALAHAVADSKASEPMVVNEISRLELLMGTKNSQSMRAWLRDRAAGVRPRGEVARSSARRLAHVGAREPVPSV